MKRRNFLRDLSLFIFALIFGYTLKREEENILLKRIDSTMVRGKSGNSVAVEIKNLEGDLEKTITMFKDDDKVKKITPLNFRVKGNANFFNKGDGKWYSDSTYTTLANDDTSGIIEFLNYHKKSNPYEPIIFPRRNYLITNSIVIPQECRNIDFNYSSFQYMGENNTYCITGGAITKGILKKDIIGGYVYADWRNLFILCNPSGKRKGNGVDFTRLRDSNLTNITVNNANIAIKMDETWASSLNRCKAFYCNIGISTGRSCNGTNISKANIESCKIGIQIGNSESNNNKWGINGLTINNATLVQKCDTAIELYYIKQASVVNSYFEANNRVIDIPLMTPNDTIHNFIFDSNMIDIAEKKECFLRLKDNSRKVSMSITKNTFAGYKPINTFFHRDPAVLGSIGKMDVTGNWFSDNITFNDIFPETWKMGALRTDIMYSPTINEDDWDVYQSVKISCLGNSTFELTGAIKRKSGSISNVLIKKMPYYFTSETLKFNYLIPQTIDGKKGSRKTVRLEVRNLQDIRLYTEDNKNLSPINLNGIRWSTRSK